MEAGKLPSFLANVTPSAHTLVPFKISRRISASRPRPQSRLEGFATWIGGGVASAFFSSLEKTSCVGLAVTDNSDSEGEDAQGLFEGHLRSDKALPAEETGIGDRSGGIAVQRFHHVEFWCGDASNTWRRFLWGLGMNLVAKSDQSTGNQIYCSYVLRSDQLVFAFTAPYSQQIDRAGAGARPPPDPSYSAEEATQFFERHGLAVRAVGVVVEDAERAYEAAVMGGAVGVAEPRVLTHEGGAGAGGRTKVAEVALYGDVVLRLVSNHGFAGPYLPNYEAVETLPISYGIRALDRAVGGVPSARDAARYVGKFAGLHEIRGGSALANDRGTVVLALNEPDELESRTRTFLEHNEGAGLQRLALACDDIFSTVREMRMRTEIGGFEFSPAPSPAYYEEAFGRIEGIMTAKQRADCEELGILVDEDDRGLLLRIVTQPLGDRRTMVIEVIQRIHDPQLSAASGRRKYAGGESSGAP